MIYTSSIIDGFKVILGSVPIHIAMLLAMVITIRVPRASLDDEMDTLSLELYVLVATTHSLLFLLGLLSHFCMGGRHNLVA